MELGVEAHIKGGFYGWKPGSVFVLDWGDPNSRSIQFQPPLSSATGPDGDAPPFEFSLPTSAGA